MNSFLEDKDFEYILGPNKFSDFNFILVNVPEITRNSY